MTRQAQLAAAGSETEDWIDDLVRRLDWQSREKTLDALIAALHALRDGLPWDEAVQVGAFLPLLLRGFYYEGWHPTARSLPLTTRDAFLERIHDTLHQEPGVDAELVARAVFSLLAERLPPTELEDAKAVTPKALHAFWPV